MDAVGDKRTGGLNPLQSLSDWSAAPPLQQFNKWIYGTTQIIVEPTEYCTARRASGESSGVRVETDWRPKESCCCLRRMGSRVPSGWMIGWLGGIVGWVGLDG